MSHYCSIIDTVFVLVTNVYLPHVAVVMVRQYIVEPCSYH